MNLFFILQVVNKYLMEQKFSIGFKKRNALVGTFIKIVFWLISKISGSIYNVLNKYIFHLPLWGRGM